MGHHVDGASSTIRACQVGSDSLSISSSLAASIHQPTKLQCISKARRDLFLRIAQYIDGKMHHTSNCLTTVFS